jgi:hypothetical protein
VGNRGLGFDRFIGDVQSMKAKKRSRVCGQGNLVVAPPPASKQLPGAVPVSELDANRKHPLDAREHALARDSRGKPLRTELRKEVKRISGPRQSLRPAERRSQSRSHKAGKK